ncbi:Crp/Fnr family transcriptional regulator [Roseomonas eburnea]|uniref:Crp/Fnr family transcriptional regulator n=1 Tax=Neoroseomonas eburnea TaxID=1346889 RepID=A0A9X9XG04_9PROT|nr:Crp/Fnr family transcriptional regulator [Neoroseomonas eburnea]MBR0682640.1 Crp/Fnr family transcriptional regulator [Neoroseomonas eburnea]
MVGTASLERLRRLAILSKASEDSLRHAAEVASWRSYGPGGLILDLEDASSDVWFVLEGAVRIQVRTPAGRELILTDIPAGGMFGEIAAIDGAPRTAAATALVKSSLCMLPAAAFLDAACSTPAACRDLLRHVTEILRRQSKRLLEREALPVRLRVHAELLRLSRPRTGNDGRTSGEERVISPPPRQHVLAARIGARREAVSREFGELMRQGTIARERGGIVIRRPDALRRALDAELEAETDL